MIDNYKCDKCLSDKNDITEEILKDDPFPSLLLDDIPNKSSTDLDLLHLIPSSSALIGNPVQTNILQTNTYLINDNKQSKTSVNVKKEDTQKLSSWLELFADLDPLANPELAKKISGNEAYSQDA